MALAGDGTWFPFVISPHWPALRHLSHLGSSSQCWVDCSCILYSSPPQGLVATLGSAKFMTLLDITENFLLFSWHLLYPIPDGLDIPYSHLNSEASFLLPQIPSQSEKLLLSDTQTLRAQAFSQTHTGIHNLASSNEFLFFIVWIRSTYSEWGSWVRRELALYDLNFPQQTLLDRTYNLCSNVPRPPFWYT